MGKKKLLWILVLIFCFVLCIGGIAAKNIHSFAQIHAEPMQADLEWLEEIKQMLSEGSSPYTAIPWSEQKPCEQYSYADWNGSTFVSSNREIKEEKTGEYLGSVAAYGWESLDSLAQTKNIWYIRHGKKAELYRIQEISERFAVAVRLEGEKGYYAYTKEDYVPETLGDFVEDLNLKEYLKISAEFECGNSPEETYRGDITDALWDILLSQKETKIQKKPHHSVFVSDEEVGDTVFTTAILYELTGWGHITFYVSERGYIGINQPLLNPEYIFPVGEDAAEEFFGYIRSHCQRVDDGHKKAGQNEAEREDENAGGRTSEGGAANPVIPWEERELYQQYPFADWDGGTYCLAKTSIGQEIIGRYLCDLDVYGFEDEACMGGVRHKKNAKIYCIDQVSERFAIAVCLADNEEYYVYTREDYVPEALGDFVEDLNLTKYLEIDTYFECGDALEQAYTGDIGTVFWDTFLSQKEVKCQKKPHHNSKVRDSDLGFTVFETHVSYTLAGWENVLFYMSGNGYIGTNLLPDECVFPLGKDTGEKFLEYVRANFQCAFCFEEGEK